VSAATADPARRIAEQQGDDGEGARVLGHDVRRVQELLPLLGRQPVCRTFRRFNFALFTRAMPAASSDASGSLSVAGGQLAVISVLAQYHGGGAFPEVEVLGRHLASNRNCRTLLVEKTDRLYRNLKDYVTINGLGLTIHFVKENVVLSPESRSNEKFMHGIKVLMAKNYIDNLSEEMRKGILEKARQGIWPSYARLGYQNILGQDGKRTIALDLNLAPAISAMFERYATRKYSLKEIAKLAQADGMAYRKSGAAVPKSTLHKILSNRVYSGDFDFDGTTYKGTHEPIVSHELWEQLQLILSGAAQRRPEWLKRASRSAASSHAATAAAPWG